MKKKANRLDAIKMIISSKEVGSQEELLQELNREGFELTQATLSRDLKQLKVAKAASMNGKYVYVLPNNIMYKRSTDQSAGEMLRNNGFISLQFSGNIAVIRTRPGYASSMAYDIDNNEFSEILGTIAGDDTIMLVLREGVAISKIRQLLSLIIPNIDNYTYIIYKEMDTQQIDVMVADASHEVYVDTILETIRNAAAVRGTGIAERTHEYVATKMKEGKAIIALCGDTFAGFTYIESWGNKQYVATSGLIVHPDFRGLGLAKRIKQASFQLARLRWPKAKIFSLTSGAAVMKMNTELGYVPVTFNELTDDEAFWKGCEGCINHDILVAKNRKFCICTAMLYDPTEPRNIKKEQERNNI